MDYAHTPTASTSVVMGEEAPRPQAGPLPTKRGEIGYMEDVHGSAMAQMDREIAASRPTAAMPERHPADHSPTVAGATGGAATTTGAASMPAQANGSTSSLSIMKRRRRPWPMYRGIMLGTLFRFALQLLILAGTGVGWAFAIITLNNQANRGNQANQTDPNLNSDQTGLGGPSTTIFIHVAFAVVTLAELVFLERRIFRIRAERYAYLHPGEMLPRGRGRILDPSMPMAPWQRPSLPTYAAALAQSGARTGDVEDALIAQPPPPAYGKTRGSTLLLQGFFNAEHQRRARIYDEEAQVGPDGEALDSIRDSMVIVEHPSRPASYRSVDSEWEARMDMERARAVEQALAVMEGVPQAHLSDRDRP